MALVQIDLFSAPPPPVVEPERRGRDLTHYDFVVANSSAGKDSAAMLDYLYHLAKEQGVLDRIVVVHCDLGERVEWAGTRELAIEQAEHYGFPLRIVSRRQGDLLDHVAKRGKWPSNMARYCTSDHKRAQVYRVFTELVAEKWDGQHPVRILNCMGLRAQESPARRKKPAFTECTKASNGKRQVDEWLPIHEWTEDQVWVAVRQSGVRHHFAYDLGMPRLSCALCIFSSRDALLIAGHHNRKKLDQYVRIETEINHTFRQDLSLKSIQEDLERGVPIPTKVTTWERCA